jgi:hypothetical protein
MVFMNTDDEILYQYRRKLRQEIQWDLLKK